MKRIIVTSLILVLLWAVGCNAELQDLTSAPTSKPVTTFPPTVTTGTPSPSLTTSGLPAMANTPSASSIHGTRTLSNARVVTVIDGDTIQVDANGQTYTLNYLGIDAPEATQPCGMEAFQKNRDLVEGQMVRIESDISATPGGTLQGYVYAGDLLINAELVRLGLAQATAIFPTNLYGELLESSQNEAKKTASGIWALPVPSLTVISPTEKLTPPPRD